jgi:hypothetical protein
LIFIFTLVKTLKSRLVEELYKGKEDHSLAGDRFNTISQDRDREMQGRGN